MGMNINLLGFSEKNDLTCQTIILWCFEIDTRKEVAPPLISSSIVDCTFNVSPRARASIWLKFDVAKLFSRVVECNTYTKSR